MSQNVRVYHEVLAKNEGESRPGDDAYDVLVGTVEYRKGRGYVLAVRVATETREMSMWALLNGLDSSTLVEPAARFNMRTLEKVAERVKGQGPEEAVSQVKRAYFERTRKA